MGGGSSEPTYVGPLIQDTKARRSMGQGRRRDGPWAYGSSSMGQGPKDLASMRGGRGETLSSEVVVGDPRLH